MQRNAVGAVVRHTAVVVIAISAGMLAGFPTAADVGAQPRGHSIYMTAVEFRGSTTTDKLAPPPIDPPKLSQGYTYKAPGQADPLAPRRWERSEERREGKSVELGGRGRSKEASRMHRHT